MTTVTAIDDTRSSMYRNAYHADLDKNATEETDPNALAGAEANPDNRPLSPEEETYKQRYDSLKSHHDKTIVPLRQRIQDLETQMNKTNERQLQLPKTQDEMTKWATEFPDAYKHVLTVVRSELAETEKSVKAQVAKLEKETRNFSVKEAQVKLAEIHPDFSDLRNDPKFHEWAQEQPSEIQKWLYDAEFATRPEYAAKAVTLYKVDKGITKKAAPTMTPEERNRLAAGGVNTGSRTEAPGTQQKKVWKVSEIQKLSAREFEKAEADIDAAAREGRISQD